MKDRMEQRILVVLPHPDDEAFGLSGTLAKYISQGAQVTYACLTLGEMGRNMGIPPFATRVTLPEIRKKELEQSCRAIGIQDLRMLGFHDKTIEFEDQEQLDGRISALLTELNPSLVITFYPGFSVHPDHDACGAAVIRTIGKIFPRQQDLLFTAWLSATITSKRSAKPMLSMMLKISSTLRWNRLKPIDLSFRLPSSRQRKA